MNSKKKRGNITEHRGRNLNGHWTNCFPARISPGSPAPLPKSKLTAARQSTKESSAKLRGRGKSFSKSLSLRKRRARVSACVLEGSDAEFLFQRAKSGKFYFRIGQVWKMPKLHGSTALLIDLDNCKKLSHIGLRKRLSQCGVSVLQIIRRVSPSGRGLHVIVYIQGRFNRYQRVALQAICESDPAREAANFRRAKLALPEWKENWNVLFK